MSDRLKKIVIAFLFLIVVSLIALGIYLYFFKPAIQQGNPPSPTSTSQGGSLPSAGQATSGTTSGGGQDFIGLPSSVETQNGETQTTLVPTTSMLREGVAQQLSPSADGTSARYYDPVDGKFYKINADGLEKQLGNKSYPNVETVTWGNTSDQAILQFPDGSKIHVDFETGKQDTIPKHWEDFSFSTDDKSIVAKTISTSPESRYLIIADPDGTNTRAIEPLGENANKAFSTWTNNNQIIAYALTGEAMGLDRQQIIMVGKNHENYQGLLVEGRGFEPLWSPSGQLVLYSVWTVANGFKPELWISGGAPGNMNDGRRKLDLQTWASKCAWYKDVKLYCAVPDSLQEGAGLQPDQYKYVGKDSIIEINLENGSVTNLGQPSGEPSVKNPIVTKDGEHLIFTDASTGSLYDFRIQ